AARATLDLNDGLYCLRFLLMILLLVEMMNQSLGTCPNFGVHFNCRVVHFSAFVDVHHLT
ncbi:hypothetical protein LWH94_14880, partial [Marinobacter sp. G11]|uniref:hypothetical protein n=1 Tax=Marinobacter sp. G11 TaxID=2903522 RepID=UPI001E615AD8